VGSTSTGSARSDLRAVVGTADPLGGGRDSKSDGQGREVEVLGDGDGGGVLDDGGGAVDGGDGGLLDRAGGGDVGAGDGHGGGGAQGGGDGRGAGPGRGAGHVAVGVDAGLGADGGVDAGHLGGGDVGDGCGRGVGGGGLVGGSGLVGRGRGVARGGGGGHGRGDGGAGHRSSGRGAGGRRAGGDRAVLVRRPALDDAGNVLGSLLGVQLEVVGVGLNSVLARSGGADQVVDVAVVVESRGVGGKTSQAGGIAVAVGLASSSGQNIVRLVGSVPGVAEQGDSSDVAADARGGLGQTSVVLAEAEGVARITGQDVAENSRALAVTAQDDGSLGALGVVGLHLLQRDNLAIGDGWAVVGGVGIVCDVFVIAGLARQLRADAGSEVALTAGV
jgi:hypothetical protein